MFRRREDADPQDNQMKEICPVQERVMQWFYASSVSWHLLIKFTMRGTCADTAK